MVQRTFTVKSLWDEEAGVFYCESDIEGLHIEAATLDEFEEILNATAPELIVANHFSEAELAATPLKDLVPTILWQRPDKAPAAA
ncbi:DUF1902 domain-containing protein [Breoghania sp. L-A4]|uniref:DUF1902 domain-containing protein n=1 Tax=Breoghania sp. L-A4 TaxID=2304600 RepID=UPI000E36016D|nr:DUF1902 domain-containing protein [Breoghania sp. L-A4]AXS39135.1 DUF1902 domain-containing protein [Breoghania sp. L-A4]